MRGTVKFFNVKKGWGFITGEDNKEYFAHYTEIKKDGFKTLKENEEVTFEVKELDKGAAAVNIVSVM